MLASKLVNQIDVAGHLLGLNWCAVVLRCCYREFNAEQIAAARQDAWIRCSCSRLVVALRP